MYNDLYDIDEPCRLNVRNIAALRLRSVGTKEKSSVMKIKDDKGRYFPNIVLDFDYWVLIPKEL